MKRVPPPLKKEIGVSHPFWIGLKHGLQFALKNIPVPVRYS
jgi:hypothetical protein